MVLYVFIHIKPKENNAQEEIKAISFKTGDYLYKLCLSYSNHALFCTKSKKGNKDFTTLRLKSSNCFVRE